MKASDLFLRCLEAEGVGVIFGVPGEENADLMISLLDSPIEFVACRHEQGAAFMADMHGRLTGKPGVCLSTLGPGATNLTTGVASANMDHSPLVAIVGQASRKRLHKESHQNMDAVAMFQPIAKWAVTVREAENIPEVVRKAFKLAAAEKPGAVVIELPEDAAKEEVGSTPIPTGEDRPSGGVEIDLIRHAADLIDAAERPIVLAGAGVIRAGASADLERFVDRSGAYAANTFMGKGALSGRNPRCLYSVGLGARDLALCAFEEADLVVAVGYDMVEWPPDRWNIGRAKQILHIDTRPAEVDGNYVVTADIHGDLAGTIAALAEEWGGRKRKSIPHWGRLREEITTELREHDQDASFPPKPQRLVADLRAALRDEDILISDVGAHKMWIGRHYPTYREKTCFITNGFCSMGFALPAAIAAKKLHPGRNVVAVCGDGGFLMNVQELATAVQYEIPIVAMVWDDQGYGLIRWKQMAEYKKTSHVRLKNPDFVKLAESFGCRGARIEETSQVQPALMEAFADSSRPTVIATPVDYEENLKLTDRLGRLVCWTGFD